MERIDNIPPSFQVTYQMKASTGKRFANFIVDNIVRVVLTSFLTVVELILEYVFSYGEFSLWLAEINPFVDLFIGIVIVTLYYVIMETYTQRSLGKYVTGTMVVMEDGSKPDSTTILKRTLCRFIPFEPLSFLGDKARGWHDSISKTHVVDINEYKRAVELRSSFNEIGQEQQY